MGETAASNSPLARRLIVACALAAVLFLVSIVWADEYVRLHGAAVRDWFHTLPLAVQLVVRNGLWLFYLAYGLTFLFAIWRRGWDGAERRILWAAMTYLTAQLLFSFLLVRVLKISLGAPRPDAPDPIWRPFTLDNDHHSFPSGHSADAFAGFGVLDRLVRSPWLRWGGLVWAVIIALGRVVQYQHYLSDVVAGALIGYLGAQAAAAIWARKFGPNHRSSA